MITSYLKQVRHLKINVACEQALLGVGGGRGKMIISDNSMEPP